MLGGIGAQIGVLLRPELSSGELALMSKLNGEDFEATDRPTAKRIRRLVEIQQERCALSGIKLATEDANLDHIVPIASGGLHQMGNVQIVHKLINQMKSTLPQDVFVNWCRLVVKFVDSNEVPANPSAGSVRLSPGE